MADDRTPPREGSLEAPTRHPLDWKNPAFFDRAALDAELERVFDICHGCRRCVSLCHAFPTLFTPLKVSFTVFGFSGSAIQTPSTTNLYS